MSSTPQASTAFPELIGRRTRLSHGGQATVSLVAGHGSQAETVLKEFRSVPGVEAALDEEVAALDRLRSLVHGESIEGWTVSIPAVVAVDRRPPRLALSRVPGAPLDALIRKGWNPPIQVAVAFAEIFGRYWRSSGRPLGDVNLENLLCAPATRELAIVDPGLPNDLFELREATRHFYPASRDLGCLLHQVLSTNVSLHVVRRGDAAMRLAFVREVIGASIAGRDDRDAFLEEIGECAAAHLARVKGGGVLRSAWRLAVRQAAGRALPAQVTLMRKGASCA